MANTLHICAEEFHFQIVSLGALFVSSSYLECQVMGRSELWLPKSYENFSSPSTISPFHQRMEIFNFSNFPGCITTSPLDYQPLDKNNLCFGGGRNFKRLWRFLDSNKVMSPCIMGQNIWSFRLSGLKYTRKGSIFSG